jgi:hypothetical protein
MPLYQPGLKLQPDVILFATALIILSGNAAMAMTLNSPAFQQNGHIPSKYTCEGEDVSPPLAWEGVSNGTKSLVLIIDDPDAPDPKAPKIGLGTLGRLQPSARYQELAENAGKAQLPQGALPTADGAQGTAADRVGRCRAAFVSPIGMVRGTSMEGGRATTDIKQMRRPLRRPSLLTLWPEKLGSPPILLRLPFHRLAHSAP